MSGTLWKLYLPSESQNKLRVSNHVWYFAVYPVEKLCLFTPKYLPISVIGIPDYKKFLNLSFTFLHSKAVSHASPASQPGLKYLLCYFVAMGPGTSFLTSLVSNLYFVNINSNDPIEHCLMHSKH